MIRGWKSSPGAHKVQPGRRHKGEFRAISRGIPGTRLAIHLTLRPSPGLILTVFFVAQVFDGLLTYAAVAVLGVAGEGNALLAAGMAAVGTGPTLVVAKTVASACGLWLHVQGCYAVLGALTGLYLFGAITPWLVVFHNL